MKKIILSIILCATLLPILSRAQEYTLIEPLPCIPGTGNNCVNNAQTTINLATYIDYVFKFSIALAAFLAVIMIIWGGLEWMVSEVPFIKTSGKEKIWNAIIGLVMVLASYLILATIDPRLVQINTSIPKLNVDTSNPFSDKLAQDLQKINVQSRLEVIEMDSQIKSLQEERAGLDASFARGEITKEQYDLKKAINTQETNKLEVATAKKIASASATIGFEKAVYIINNESSYEYANETGAYLDQNSKEAVSNLTKGFEDIYTEKIAELKYKQDFEGAKFLEDEKKFFIAQIEEEQKLTSNVVGYKNKVSDDLELRAALDKYKKQLEVEKKYQTTYANTSQKTPRDEFYYPLSLTYEKVLEGRIQKIEAALKK